MTCLVAFLFVAVSLTAPLLFAGDFCRGGLHADGVIDWSAATISINGQNETITAPVRGIAGLVATVATAIGPATGVIDPNTLSLSSSGTMTFNHPVKALASD